MIVRENGRVAGWIGAIVGAVGGFFVTGAVFDKPGYFPLWQAAAGGAGFGTDWVFGRAETRPQPDPDPFDPIADDGTLTGS